MALRENECFLVRRVAARGIDKNIGCLRAREDRFNRDRRFAARGNEIGNRDPRDIIEIRRLRQRVRDLEEIRRLRKRVRDLELQREKRVMKTESGPIVRNDVNEEEENRFCRHPARFYEPIYQECVSEEEDPFMGCNPIYDSPPRYDVGEDAGDEEECLLVHQVLNEVAIQVDEQVQDKEHIFDGFLNDDVASHGGTMEAKVAHGCATMNEKDLLSDPVLPTPTKEPTSWGKLKFSWINSNATIHSRIQKEDIRDDAVKIVDNALRSGDDNSSKNRSTTQHDSLYIRLNNIYG